MDVGVVTAPLDSGTGGPGIYLRNLCRHLADRDDISLSLIHYNKTDDQIYDQTNEIRLSRLPGRFERGIAALNLDVLHYNYIPYKRPLVFTLNVPIIVTVHGDLPFVMPEYVSWKHRHLWTSLQQLYSRLGLLDNINAFIPVSRTVGDNVAEALSLPNSKFKPVWSGVDKQFQPVENAEEVVRSRYNISPPYLLNVNNYMPVKNRKTVVQAFEHLADKYPDLTLVLVGDNWEKSDIPRIIETLSSEDRVVDLGFVANNRLPALYTAASAFINPSLHETFGFPNLEAMACGCPVVSSNCYAIPEIVGDEAVLLDNPEDPEALASEIITLLNNDQYRETLARAGRHRTKQFSWSKTTDGIIRIYKQVVGATGTQDPATGRRQMN
jgi:glycosyltransferase involved in cell wall biosynthesis